MKRQLLRWQNAVSWERDRTTSLIYSEPEDDFGMPEQTATNLKALLDAIVSDEDTELTQGTRDKQQSLLLAFDPEVVRKRTLKGPQVDAEQYSQLCEEEKKEVEDANKELKKRPMQHFKPRDRRPWPWMLERVSDTEKTARKRDTGVIGRRITEVQLHTWLREVWGSYHVPGTYGQMVSHWRFSTPHFPDTHICSRIPDIWRINTNEKSKRSLKPCKGKHILPNLFDQVPLNLTK